MSRRPVSRRVFLHSTGVIPAAFASSELLWPSAAAAMQPVDIAGQAVEVCDRVPGRAASS